MRLRDVMWSPVVTVAYHAGREVRPALGSGARPGRDRGLSPGLGC